MLSFLASTVLLAQEQPRNFAFENRLRSVAVFRDGFGYYVREGRVKLENGWATTNFLPSAIRGTLWVYTLDKGDTIDQVVSTRDNKLEFSSPQDLRARLADKIGLRMAVVLRNGQRFEGELARLLDDMLLLRVGEGYNAIPYDQVGSVILLGYPVRIKVQTSAPNKVTTLGFAYLQEGIRWEPSYVLSFSGKDGMLSLRGSLQNTTQNLENTDVYFVVGSPYVANRGLTDLLNVLPMRGVPAGSGFGGGGYGSMSGKAEADSNAAKDAPAAEPEMPAARPPLASNEAGELYYYLKPNLTLASNDINMVTILQAAVPVSPMFDWNADGEDVAYLLSFKNVTRQPLTTGPVFVIEDGKAIGQETIKYTPSGDMAEVRLARGIGIKVERAEEEVRRGAGVKVGDANFIPVTLRGTLTVTNFRKDSAVVRISRTVRGRIVSQTDGGKVTSTQLLAGEPNPIADLEWRMEVPPGKTKSVGYVFEQLMFAARNAPPVPEKSGEPG